MGRGGGCPRVMPLNWPLGISVELVRWQKGMRQVMRDPDAVKFADTSRFYEINTARRGGGR